MTTESTDLVPLVQVREAVLSGYVPDVVDSDELAREFAERLLNVKSREELFSVTEARKVQDMLGEPFLLTDSRFLKSDFEDSGFTVYALVSGVTADGEPFAVACGGRNIVVQCLRAKEEGWLPWPVYFTEAGRERANRSRPIYLVTDEKWAAQLEKQGVNGEVVN